MFAKVEDPDTGFKVNRTLHILIDVNKDPDTYSDNREDKRPRSAAATKADHSTTRGQYPDKIINDIIQFVSLESQFVVLDKVKALKDILRRPTSYKVRHSSVPRSPSIISSMT
ncbi:hypothetical protein WICPIJ_006046 [Wickerhamomyces pijperi]|uniref:Uncharacterized protein n=1 Tax=Wickerhamomyces pijperi TaxID=599730 RepID=A0A9P8TLS2_WICPI|nr:hypothetical protein WICPIJ_006046 [Wickerhamomyces pijperi]